ncbi:MAG TPA: hypothetical protein DCG09_00700 [Ruminococcus sp.]|uniref:hypothetical protein n=1 Tax=Ruminococcus sp. TaxID=41978 RepID=UPI000EC2D72D|nr:hypothetical protein [Ruminococcus sp.]HAE55748.1 hypothetical protein [Ruminococcus sp.]
MKRDEIILAAKCCIVDNCGPCPLMGTDNCITGFMNHILEYMKNEPAPAATGTSSEVSVKEDTDNIHLDDNTKGHICQAYNTADEACTNMFTIYEGMSECEQRAFDIGEVYGKIYSTRDKLETFLKELTKEGERKCQ